MKNVVDEMHDCGFDGIRNNLRKEYMEALSNDNFREFVSKLKLSDDVLMKYTTRLTECASNYDNCIKCKNIMDCAYKIVGYCYLPKVIDGRLEFDYQPCKYKKKLDIKTNYMKNIYSFDIPNEIREADIKKIHMKDSNRYKAIEWVHEFLIKYRDDNKQKGLYLYGNFGCGKTYLISALFNELAKQNIKSAIVFWPEFLRDLKSSFNSDFDSKYNYIKKIPLLLIDDIGAENTTAWGRDEIFCPLIQYRMQEHLPTFFTSNLDLKSLENHFSVTRDNVDVVKSRRIIERIKQLSTEMELVSKNLRN